MVSWLDVQAFLQATIKKLPGCPLGLPTEAEWEYACRAGSQTAVSFGETISTDQINFNGNYPLGNGKSHPVWQAGFNSGGTPLLEARDAPGRRMRHWFFGARSAPKFASDLITDFQYFRQDLIIFNIRLEWCVLWLPRIRIRASL